MSHTHARSRRKYVRYHMDALETRTLMSITVSPIDTPNFDAAAYRNPADNHLWIVNFAGTVYLTDTNGTANIDLSGAQPNFHGFVITGGHAYLSDNRGGIDDINLSDTNGTVTYISLTNDPHQTPQELVVTTNAIWFTCVGFQATDDQSFTNYVGRWVPGNNPADFLPLNGTLNDSAALSISANGADGVWVGMDGLDNAAFSGKNHLVKVSYSSGSFSSATVAVNSGDPVPDVNNHVLSVASDGSGGVWYTLSNEAAFGSTRTANGVETIVHLASDNSQTPYQVTTDPNAVLQVSNLTLGPGHRLWFDEIMGSEAGYLDTVTGQFDTKPYLTGTVQPNDVIVNPAADEAIILTGTNVMLLYQVDAPTITFNGTASNLTSREDIAINNTLLATFTAPDLPAGQHYTATITWGDTTSSIVTAQTMGSHMYAVIVNGKVFSTQGTYNGSITISSLSNASVGSLTFTSYISDIPLNLSNFSVTPLLLRIVAVTATFTDDGDLPLSTFTATINWGDNTTSTGLIVRDPLNAGRYLVIGAHQYSKKGTYSVKLTVTTSETNPAITNNTATATVTAR